MPTRAPTSANDMASGRPTCPHPPTTTRSRSASISGSILLILFRRIESVYNRLIVGARARTINGTVAAAPEPPVGAWPRAVAAKWMAPLLVAVASAIAVFHQIGFSAWFDETYSYGLAT